LRLAVHEKSKHLDWTQLIILNSAIDALMFGLPAVEDKKVILRRANKSLIEGHYESDSDDQDTVGMIKEKKGLYLRKVRKVKKVKKKTIDDFPLDTSDSEEDVSAIKRIHLAVKE
jgi:hypothetical protein